MKASTADTNIGHKRVGDVQKHYMSEINRIHDLLH